MKKTTAILVAAGRGTRAGTGGPKQYRLLAGQAVLARTTSAFLAHPQINEVRVIIHRDDRDLYDEAMISLTNSLGDTPGLPVPGSGLLEPVFGGAERQDSVRLGLESLENAPPDYVLIHDAARPFVDAPTISRVLAALSDNSGAIAALPVFDTIKMATETDLSAEGNWPQANAAITIHETVPRDRLWRAQTPQGFRYADILGAHKAAAGKTLTDDAAVAEFAGLRVQLVNGSPDNMKITQAEDFGMAETLLSRSTPTDSTTAPTADSNADPNPAHPAQNYEYRTGQGFDVHAFDEGDAAILCGVTIAHTHKLKGHSDADVGMHALTDAILGALAQGDIGDHFPPSDPQWKGVASKVFLQKACSLVSELGGTLTHCDITLMCEAPKIGPHRLVMRESLSAIMGLPVERISVKATTTEQLGFTGRREGIAALATATVRLPVTIPHTPPTAS